MAERRFQWRLSGVLAQGCLWLATGIAAMAQGHAIPLWPGGAPGEQAGAAPDAVRVTPEGDHVITHVRQPSLTPYLPAAGSATGAAVIVIPGGGHR